MVNNNSKTINDLPLTTIADVNAFVPIWNTSAGATERVTVSALSVALGGLTQTSADALYETKTSAAAQTSTDTVFNAATYETKTSADAFASVVAVTYETKVSADAHATAAALAYETKVSAASTYLTISNAATTYETKVSASNIYETKISAASTYETKASAASIYETKVSASLIYETKASASTTYETKASASSTYETKASASSTYETKASAASVYETKASAASIYETKTSADAAHLTPFDDVFLVSVDFTASVTTELTLSQTPTSEAYVMAFMDSNIQIPDTWSLSANKVTFDAAIPTGVGKVYFKGWV